MGKLHKPRPVLINEPTFPIHSILRAAEIWSMAHEFPESLALRRWAKERIKVASENRAKLPKQERLVYKAVFDATSVSGEAVTTEYVVGVLIAWGEGRPSGTRGALSRLVEKGHLCRVSEGFYWPADVAYDKEGNLP